MTTYYIDQRADKFIVFKTKKVEYDSNGRPTAHSEPVAYFDSKEEAEAFKASLK